ncbi:MAG: AAA family ATPase [Prevotella sp.]|nr:AAA family ATPase [Prevotella sp.]
MIPSYEEIMLPLLQFLSDGETHSLDECTIQMCNHFHLTKSEQEELIPSGKITDIRSRTLWARFYMAHAGLIKSAKRGEYFISEEGLKLLATNPTKITTVGTLMRYPSFVEFRNSSQESNSAKTESPQESIDKDDNTASARRELYDSFLKRFPLESLSSLPIDKYIYRNKDEQSFCYWVKKSNSLGSVGNIHDHVFGIHKSKPDNRIEQTDGVYSWEKKLESNSPIEAYKIVRNALIDVATYAFQGNFEKIETIDLFGNVFKWKIAFLYSRCQLVPMYKHDDLIKVATFYGMTDAKDASISEIQHFLMNQKGERDLFDYYTNELLPVWFKVTNNAMPASYRSFVQGDGRNSQIVKGRTTNLREPTDKQYWWLTGSPKYWSPSKDWKLDEDVDYTLYNEDGNKRRIFKHFTEAKPNDMVIAYEATPILQIVAIGRVVSETDGEVLYIRKIEELSSPVPYSEILTNPLLKNSEPVMNRCQGSLFRLTFDEYKEVMRLIRKDNPKPMKDDGQTKVYVPYTDENFLENVFLDEHQLQTLKSLLIRKKNLILQGAPGVGKTFAAKRLAYAIMGEKDDDRIELVQFHQNYTYEDFIMGYKPTENGGFTIREGVFYRFCKRAEDDTDRPYFFIIDEINRGNLSKIFGELLMLIEKDYRGTNARLAYRDEEFFVPRNVFIIGMMNTADRSLAMIDYALRRRFSFFEMHPAFQSEGFKRYQEGLANEKFNQVIEAVVRLNDTIMKDDSLGSGFCIGHSYFCNQEKCDELWLSNVIEYDLLPMIREYWFDNDKKYKEESEKLMSILK